MMTMAPQYVEVLAAVLLISLSPVALRAEAPPTPPAAPSSAETPAKAAEAAKADDAWYAPLKDMKLGPGSLSIDASLRMRYEYTDNGDVLTYNAGVDDDV